MNADEKASCSEIAQKKRKRGMSSAAWGRFLAQATSVGCSARGQVGSGTSSWSKCKLADL